MNNETKSHSETHKETSPERNVRLTLYRIDFVGVVVGVLCASLLFGIGLTTYRQMTYVDPVNPDYSLLDAESNTYWTDRITFDIETAMSSAGTDEVRQHRLRRFIYQTLDESLALSSSYGRAQAATNIAVVLAEHDIDIILDNHLQQLGETPLIVAMRARALISQALMYIRLGKTPAAQVAMQKYNRLVRESDLKLNSTYNEESFFGAVTVLKCLGDQEALKELFRHTMISTDTVGIDQRMRAYRLIAGEQIRVGMTSAALETAKSINNLVELSRAWALVLQYTARPMEIAPVEPTMLNLLAEPQTDPLPFPVSAEQVLQEIFQYLVNNKDLNTQTILLQQIAGFRLIYDKELYHLFRRCLTDSPVLDPRVKQSVLKYLDDPESPTIRMTLGMSLRGDPLVHQANPIIDDWTTSDDPIFIEPADIDPTPLRSRNDQQWLHALLAIAQSYQSVKRFQDADRVLKRAFVAAQKFSDTSIRVPLLLRIGEQQIGIGSIADAQKTFTRIAPELNQNQKSDLARLQIIARLYEDALATISQIKSPEIREYVCSFLLQEQIRTRRVRDAEKTLALMPPNGRAFAESRNRWNIAKEQAVWEDFAALGLANFEGTATDREKYCMDLVQQGFYFLADQATDGIRNAKKRTDARIRISREYLLLYQAFNDANDSDRTIRKEIQQLISSLASRTDQPVAQTAILTGLLMYLTERLSTEADRAEGKRLWAQAIDSYRRIDQPTDKAVLFAQLIVAKNLLEAPNLQKKTMPLFTKTTHETAFAETELLIAECLALFNSLVEQRMLNEAQQSKVCVHLAMAVTQVGRTKSAQMLIDRVLEINPHISDHAESVSILLATIPTLKAMNSAETIPVIYRMAIEETIRTFTNKTVNVDVFDWRLRDSELEQIVRSQMENGFMEDAVESATRLNEPVLRDRLLRTAAYIFLDHEDITRASWEASRMTVKEIQEGVLQNIQIIERRSRIRPSQNQQEVEE